ncbi:uncharacterized protein K02A2.6-like [Malaya genurostris]|uniref:uncharacterized protein K02A2.6-like n=1 Tax=Malaya genurostris TaxID=325434 RepID=UPI0026F39E33|nr:uncharacterized protein K02A2.6-like [Malaya genurostris]
MDSDGKYVRIRKDFVAYSSDEELEQEASHNSIAESNSENCDSRSDCSETYSDHSQCPVIDSDCAGQQDSEDSRLSRDEINDPVIARTTDGESDPQTNTNTNTQKGDSDRMQQIEKILAELTKAFKHCESNMPTNRQTEHSWDFSGETSKPQNSYPNVRLEHINRFPSGIRPNQMLAEWFEFIENFEVAMSLYNANDPVYRSKLLYLSLGQELQAIVKAANLRPALIDTNCYRTFVENIENHLRSMTDTAAEHRAFLSMKQEKGESTVAFHARLVRNVKLCGYSVCDQNRFVRAQLLDGLKNKELVKAARTYGHDTNFIVQSSTRYEAYESEITQQPIDPNVFEIGRNHGYNKRSNQWIDNSQCKYRRMNQNYTQDHRSSYIDRGNSYFKQPSGLHLNTQTRGRRSRCPRKCNACGQQGHFSVTCRSKRLRPVEQRELGGEPSGDEISVDSKQNINAISLDEALIDCSVASCKPIRFLIDSGADVNVIGGKDWLNLKRELKADSTELEIIQQSQKHLHAYASTQPMPIECIFKANVEVLGAEKPSVIALFYVVPNGIRSLLGRSTASDLKLLQVGMSVNSVKTLDHIFPKMPGVSVKFNNAYYNVPAAFREAARQRLRDMEKQGIIEKVTAAPSWISGMSAVAKDLSNAFYHLELDEESRELTTFLAENGMYRFTRLMFGVNCAPEIFQREMTRLFIGMENVIVYIDDILVFAKSLEELRITVRKVLEILRINNLTLNNNKCEFDKERIKSREESKRALTRADGWALRLSPYSYEIEYVRGRDNIADPSSRLYDGEDEPFNDDISPWEIAALEANAVNILTEQEIASATLKDETLQRVITALETGQWSDVDERYKKVREDLSIRDGIIMKTGCAVIPTTLQNKALEISHEGHPSIAKMKSIIRQRVWWPGVAKMVQKWVESCETCAINGKPERPTPMQRMFAPKVVWETIAIDFNGPYVIFGGISILVAIDYRSRYLIARPVKSTGFESTRKVLEEIFDKEGYPKNIKSDNGPPFNGTDYKEYCAERGITALFSTPLFPQQNGLVESAMKIVNKAMNAAVCDKTSYIDELRQAIHAYNAGAHSITKLPPEEIMSGRKIKRGLPLINYQRVPIDDKALDSMDRQAKLIGKHREDYRRGARKCRVKEIPQEIFSQFDAEIV